MAPDPAYALTRSTGRTATITQVTGAGTFDPQTGDIVPSTTATVVRWVTKEPTKYSRIIRAQAVKQDIGATTFIMWGKDVPLITRLDGEDRISYDGVDYKVRTFSLEETSVVVTADEIVGS